MLLSAPRKKSQRGVSALIVALCLPPLMGLFGLVLDLGRLFVIQTEVQGAMDACALAASTQLTGLDDPRLFDVARAHAQALVDPSVSGAGPRALQTVNRLNFQRETLDRDSVEVDFSSQVDGPFVNATALNTQGLSPKDARFARCRYSDPARPLWLMPVLQAMGLPPAQPVAVTARAVATLTAAQSTCVTPMAVCIDPTHAAATSYGLRIGQRLTVADGPSSYGPGRFGWAEFPPMGNGAAGVRALLEGAGACDVKIGQAVGQPGQMSSISSSWNTRFGLYANNTSPNTAPPDFSGHGYSTGEDRFSDYVSQRAARSVFQGPVTGGTTEATPSQLISLGQQRRVVSAPLVDCSGWNSGKANTPLTVLDFACLLMLAPHRTSSSGGSGTVPMGWSGTFDVEFLGLQGQAGVPCASLGLAGGGADRFVVPGLVQ